MTIQSKYVATASTIITPDQLQEKDDALEKAQNDLANLLHCTDIAAIFLDGSLRITLFTPAAARLFDLDPTDVGRPVGDIIARFNDPELLGDAQQVLRQPAPSEKEVATGESSWWMRRLMPYRTRDDRVDGIVITFVDVSGVHRDLTERRQLEREVVEAASLEQWRIGQDLHDSVAQELTALRINVKDLAETLRTDPASALPLVEQMAQGLQRSQQELRAVLRGLLPVAVDAEGLMAALADLAERTHKEGNVCCVFDCPDLVSVADNLTATHLYQIAHEAVHNAVRHAQARKVFIRLSAKASLALSIQDDGSGIPARPVEGLGLRIMRNRAAIIGAELTFEAAKPTGTLVTCVLTGKKHAPDKAAQPRQSADRR